MMSLLLLLLLFSENPHQSPHKESFYELAQELNKEMDKQDKQADKDIHFLEEIIERGVEFLKHLFPHDRGDK